MAASKRKIKTVATAVDPRKFIDRVKSEVKRNDSHELVAMMQDITGEPPKMWGPTIVGFGTHHYRYASGHEGEICLTGIDNDKLMAKLGKHEHGKGCLYINKLDDIDRKVLRNLIEHSVKMLRKREPA